MVVGHSTYDYRIRRNKLSKALVVRIAIEDNYLLSCCPDEYVGVELVFSSLITLFILPQKDNLNSS